MRGKGCTIHPLLFMLRGKGDAICAGLCRAKTPFVEIIKFTLLIEKITKRSDIINRFEISLHRMKKRNESIMNRYMWIITLCIAAFFVNNGALQTDIMESRNIVTAREMVSDGNWLVPTMNGELRLEKPPLPTWVAAVVETVVPDNLKAQRAAAGMMGVVWTLFFYLTALEISKKKEYAGIATLVFLTCYNIVLIGRTATWDVYCHAFMMGAVFFLWKGLYADHRDRRRACLWRNFSLAGIGMGLSFLSKGPVSFYALLLPFLIAALVYRRPSMKGKWIAFCVMILFCVGISSWWYIYLILFHPEAVHAVIQKESGAWLHHNVRPWYYYWRFFVETGVWALLALASLAVPYWKRVIADRREYLFTLWWMLAALFLLSLMPEKKMRYLVPMMVPCSLAVGFLIYHFCKERDLEKTSRLLFYINGGLISTIAAAIPALIYLYGYRKELISLPIAIIATMSVLGVAVWLWVATVQFKPRRLLFGVTALFIVAECLLFGVIGRSFTNPEFNSIRGTREIDELKGIPFYHHPEEELRIELVYEANRKILPLEMNDGEAFLKALPCVLITRKPVKDELPEALLQKVDTTLIGIYDDNRHPKLQKHYHEEFLNRVTLLKLKQ